MDLYENPNLPISSLREIATTYRSLAKSTEESVRTYERLVDSTRERSVEYRALADRLELILAGRIDDLVRSELPDRPFRTICGIATGRGLPCSRSVAEEGEHCRQHRSDETSR